MSSGAAELAWVDVLHISDAVKSLPFLKGIDPHNLAPLSNTVIVFVAVVLFAYLASKKIRKNQHSLVPSDKLTTQNVGELIVGSFSAILEDIIGHGGSKYLWIIGSLGVFILFSNLSGLIPGMLPPTDGINTTAGCSLIVFFSTHIIGFKQHGFGYLKQFTGPFWWLAWLMIPLEIISHLARPLSLSLRLFGNIMGDHLVFAIIVGLAPILVPIPVLVLGTFVAIVQTAVFVLLSTVYIAGAVSDAH